MKRLNFLIFVAALAISFTFVWACNGHTGLGIDQVANSGNAKAEKRNVTGFKKIDAGGAFQLEIVAGKEFSVEIEADDNVLPLIKTEVRGDTLHIERENKISFNTNRLVAKISLPELNGLNVSGASRARISGVVADDLKLEASGASRIEISGVAEEVDADLSGASRLEAGNLQVERAEVDASGASTANVFVSESIKAEASGASSISYAGNPKSVDKNASGASSVSAR
jgi:hypothetical protein